MIVRAADEMNRLIGDLLDVTRIEAGRLSVSTGVTSLCSILDLLEEAHAPAAREKGITWEVERPHEPFTLDVDEGRILQALGNLVGNAIKFTPRGGTVRVDAARNSDRLRIGVHDSGPGMDSTELAHVFDRFWQSGKGDRRGAGLGLTIARGIIEAHDGRIRMESEVGAGTTAWVELPLRPGVSIVTAFYVPAAEPVPEDELAAHCAARLAHYKCPRAFRAIPSLPRSANGKLMRRQLKESSA